MGPECHWEGQQKEGLEEGVRSSLPIDQEAEAGEWQVQGQLGELSKVLSEIQSENTNQNGRGFSSVTVLCLPRTLGAIDSTSSTV